MGRQLRVLGVAAVALIALLVVVAVQLVSSQSTARRDVEHRFLDRAKAGAALTESLFGSASSTSQPDNAKRYGGARVSPKALGQQAEQTKSLYLLLLSRKGAVISASHGTPANAI